MSTTLITFHVSIPRPSAAFVQLVGSWDNFSKPYTLARDRKVGKTVWRTCPEFTKIVCDGDRIETEPRDGGLQMGSTYWYFYLIDNDEEFADPSQPTTRACPFLPGQEVNVLEVPTMCVQRCASNLSSTSSTEFTMNPADKYAPVGQLSPLLANWSKAPPSTPQADFHPRFKNSTRAGSHRDAYSGRSLGTASPSKRFHDGKGLDSVYRHTWGSRSDRGDPPPYSAISQLTARPRSARRPCSQPSFTNGMSWLSWVPARNLWSAGDVQRFKGQLPESIKDGRPHSASSIRQRSLQELAQPLAAPLIDELNDNNPMAQKSQNVLAHEDQDMDMTTDITKLSLGFGAQPVLDTGADLSFDHEHHDFMSALEHTLGTSSLADDLSGLVSEDVDMIGERVPKRSDSYLVKSNSTRSRTTFSPSNATSVMFSRPMTPTQTEFSVDFSQSEVPQMDTQLASKQIYSLEPSQHASALTLHTLRALPDDSATTPTKINEVGSSPANRRVEEWVDRSKTMLEELREDMGYLCALIE